MREARSILGAFPFLFLFLFRAKKTKSENSFCNSVGDTNLRYTY